MPAIFEIEKPQKDTVSELHSPFYFSAGTLVQPWNAFSSIESIFEDVPASFYSAMADFHAGRVVDLDSALTEPPPNE